MLKYLLFLPILFSSHLYAKSIQILEYRPTIDGKKDFSIESLSRYKFDQTYTFDNEYSGKDISATYSIAMHEDGLYVVIETNADAISYHKRGFLYGDGYKLIVGKSKPIGISNEYLEISFSANDRKEDRDSEKYISSYNGVNLSKPLSANAEIAQSATETGTVFEAFVPWADLYPFLPHIDESFAINLYFAKGMLNNQGDYVTKGFAIERDDGIWNEAQGFRKLRHLPIKEKIRNQFPQAFRVENSTLFEGQKISLIFPNVSTSFNESLEIYSDDLLVASYDFELNDTDIISLELSAIKPGYYTIKLSGASKDTLIPITLLPNVDFESLLMQAIQAGTLDEGERDSILFKLEGLRNRLLEQKSYEASPDLYREFFVAKSLLDRAIEGSVSFYEGGEVYRRAFRSMFDGSLQPYSIRLPDNYSPQKKYPLLVFLHGSGQDEQYLLKQERGNGDFIEIAPLGRDLFHAYAFEQSSFDIDEAIKDTVSHYSVDTEKVILGGFSMGGYGALKQYSESPDKYIGVAIFAGHPNLANEWLGTDVFPDYRKVDELSVFNGTPVFIYHGTDDPALRVDLMQTLAQNLEKAGAAVTTSFVDGRGHVYQDETTHQLYDDWLKSLLETNKE